MLDFVSVLMWNIYSLKPVNKTNRFETQLYLCFLHDGEFVDELKFD